MKPPLFRGNAAYYRCVARSSADEETFVAVGLPLDLLDRSVAKPLLLAGFVFAIGTLAAKADCQSEIGAIMKKREAAVAMVNKSKAANGKLDPLLACPRLKTLQAVENEAVAYFTKNGEWCNLPPDFTEKMSTSAKRTASFAGQACSIAVKVKQMKTQQAQQQQEMAPKLPTGPL